MRTSLICLLALACGHHQGTDDLLDEEERLGFEDAPRAAERVQSADAEEFLKGVDTYFSAYDGFRTHVQIDRPLLRPGETLWVKTWTVADRNYETPVEGSVFYELLDPKGQVVTSKTAQLAKSAATNDLVIPDDAAGGQWTVKVSHLDETVERTFVVSSFRAPRIGKKLDFVREAYGAGDTVEALVELTRQGGGALANHPVRAVVHVAGEAISTTNLTTDETGAVFVSAKLPGKLSSGDGLITVLIDDAGITESISRPLPLVAANMQVDFFPEGGKLVEGLPSRVYFEAKDEGGDPADVKGVLLDDKGAKVAQLASVHDGLGRFAFTPEPGRTYRLKVTEPAGIAETYELPAATDSGCVMRTYDDVLTEIDAVRVGIRCSDEQHVTVAGMVRETPFDAGRYAVKANKETVAHLTNDEANGLQGALTVTLFDDDRIPLAERLVYRNYGDDLTVKISADREQYSPRDEVKVSVKVTNPAGEPVEGEFALAVVDDGVLQLADDEHGGILPQLYLGPDLVEMPDDPDWYYDPKEEDAAVGVDLVMGTKGYRTFEWAPVWAAATADPDQLRATAQAERMAALPLGLQGMGMGGGGFQLEGAEVVFGGPGRAFNAERRVRSQPKGRPMMAPPPMAPPMDPVMDGAIDDVLAEQAEPAMEVAARDIPMAAVAGRAIRQAKEEQMAVGGLIAMDMDRHWGGERHNGWAPVRTFPKPDYSAGFTGVRTDFRDTIAWEPSVSTDANGEASVSFYLSDATTTFRVSAEGLGGGLAGQGEARIQSVLPVSVDTKLPTAVSAGDELLVPLIVSNTRKESAEVWVNLSSSSQLAAVGDMPESVSVAGTSGDTVWVPVSIGDGAAEVEVTMVAEGGGLQDTVKRSFDVVPLGFPQNFSAAGELADEETFTFELDEVVEGSLVASVTWHPSPVSDLMEGMEGLIRQPGGCFEQTSSTNWPNVAILNYLEAHDGSPRVRADASRALATGYKKLAGYQVKAGGFETWGSGPGKEVLSAFGLLQFRDMSRVYEVDPKILSNDTDYLMSVRDGKGGYTNTGSSAHGYGSAPKPVLDGFITWSLVSTGNGAKLGKEIALQAKAGKESKDPYVLALAARTLLAVDHEAAPTAVKRLAAMAEKDGSFPGAESSITRSYEANLMVESTALAMMALMDAGPAHRSTIDASAQWLIENRQGAGTWGATQATAMALGALTQHASYSARPKSSGELSVFVNGEPMGNVSYSEESTGAITIDGLGAALMVGKNTVTLTHNGGEPMPFALDVNWATAKPGSEPGAELSLKTELSAKEARMGETVRLTATVGNAAERLVPSPIARIGLPAGLEPNLKQLEELQRTGVVAFFETRPREVTLYWDGMHADEQHVVNLDLVAALPGTFSGPASSAYPYYNDDEKAWSTPLAVSVLPPK